jgi:hypothetical protein
LQLDLPHFLHLADVIGIGLDDGFVIGFLAI